MEDKYGKSRRGQPNGGLVGGEARERERESVRGRRGAEKSKWNMGWNSE